MKLLRYIELKSEYADNGPAWIGYVTPSRSGRTLYFNGDALSKYKGQGRGSWGGEDRHWAGSGKVLVEAAALSEYLETIGAKCLDTSHCEVTHAVVPTDIERLHALANTTTEEAQRILCGGPVQAHRARRKSIVPRP